MKKLGNASLINEACLELQKNKGSKDRHKDESGKATKKQKCGGGCPFFKQDSIQSLQDQTLLQVQDIEQLVTGGRAMKACPYYASRAATSDAQVIVLPYNTLLHKVMSKNCHFCRVPLKTIQEFFLDLNPPLPLVQILPRFKAVFEPP